MIKTNFITAILIVLTAFSCLKTIKGNLLDDNLYNDAIAMLYESKLVYGIGHVVREARARKIELTMPEGFPVDIGNFETQSIDFGDKNDGLAADDIMKFFEVNEEVVFSISHFKDEEEFYRKLFTGIKLSEDYYGKLLGDDEHISFFHLVAFRSLQEKVACVYSVSKDKLRKRITVSFRGSQNPDFSTRDWRSNINARPVELNTPSLIRDKMDGNLKKRVLVHSGFYNYLFDNKRMKGAQRFDKILEDIKNATAGEEGYSIYVTGHSLGGALATMFSFKLAGKHDEWIPKPITCISYAAPRSGTAGYMKAHEQLEKDGLLRHIRINNEEDSVPTIPFMSHFGFTRRLFKHVGINMRLTANEYSLAHTTKQGLGNVFQNTIFKPVWNVMEWHGLPLHYERIEMHAAELQKMTIDGLYKNETIVGNDFKVGSDGSDEL